MLNGSKSRAKRSAKSGWPTQSYVSPDPGTVGCFSRGTRERTRPAPAVAFRDVMAFANSFSAADAGCKGDACGAPVDRRGARAGGAKERGRERWVHVLDRL